MLSKETGVALDVEQVFDVEQPKPGRTPKEAEQAQRSTIFVLWRNLLRSPQRQGSPPRRSSLRSPQRRLASERSLRFFEGSLKFSEGSLVEGSLISGGSRRLSEGSLKVL